MSRAAFPHKGYHKGFPAEGQPADTSPYINNVRPLEGQDDRIRGGQRPSSRRWSDTQLSAAGPVVEIVQVTVVESV